MKTPLEIEFYLVRLYLHPEGCYATLLEIQNFNNGENWSLFSFGWNRGLFLSFWS